MRWLASRFLDELADFVQSVEWSDSQNFPELSGFIHRIYTGLQDPGQALQWIHSVQTWLLAAGGRSRVTPATLALLDCLSSHACNLVMCQPHPPTVDTQRLLTWLWVCDALQALGSRAGGRGPNGRLAAQGPAQAFAASLATWHAAGGALQQLMELLSEPVWLSVQGDTGAHEDLKLSLLWYCSGDRALTVLSVASGSFFSALQ